jgi:type IV secretory pathway VirB2 component (pilin)
MKNVKKILLVSFLIGLFNVFFISSIALADLPLEDLPEGKSEDYGGDPNPNSLLSAPGEQGESLRICIDMGCCSICDVMTVISKAFKILRNDIALPLAIIFGIIGGIMIIFSAGSPNKVKSGRTYIISALIGLLIVFGASLIVNTVTIAIADSSWSFDNVMNGFITFNTNTSTSNDTNVGSDICKKSCTPGVDPKIKTITGTVVDLDKNIKEIIKYLAGKSLVDEENYGGFKVTSTISGKHVPDSCHYKGRAVDFVTSDKSKWQMIIDDLFKNFSHLGDNLKAFCDYNGEIKNCCDKKDKDDCKSNNYGDHIHVQVGPCTNPPDVGP